MLERTGTAMEQQPDNGGLIAVPAAEALLERAAETDARRALHEAGLDGEHAAKDIRDLRSLLAGFRQCFEPIAVDVAGIKRARRNRRGST